MALEAQYKTSYNTSIVALEEAKGTLLAYDNIALAEGPHPRKAYIQARDQQAGHGRFPRPARRPLPPHAGRRAAECRPVAPMHTPDGTPPGHPAALARPRRPALPAADAPPPPTVPAGEPNILSRNRPRAYEPQVVAGLRARSARADLASLPELQPGVRHRPGDSPRGPPRPLRPAEALGRCWNLVDLAPPPGQNRGRLPFPNVVRPVGRARGGP